MKKQLVVVGNGMAGMKCIEEIIQLNHELYEITVIGAEPRPNYNRIELSKVLQGGTSFEDIIIHDWTWYEQNGIKLYTGEKVTRIHRKKKKIETSSGMKLTYDDLLIATGSSAFIPPIPGSDQEGVIAFRSMDDCLLMMDYAREFKKAIVIGGGLLGLEAARGLLNLGMETEVIHNAAYLMNRQLDPMSAGLLQTELEAQGMKFRLGQQTVQIIGDGRAKGIRLASGSKLTADLIVFAVGISPNVDIGRDSGLAVSRGIIVDDYMQTSDKHIYAVGECAEHQGICYGLVAPLYDQARVLSRKLCHMTTEAYQGSIPYSKLKVSGVDLFSVGEIGPDISVAVQEYDRLQFKYKKVTMRNGKLIGAILYGDTTESQTLLGYIKHQADVHELTAMQSAPAGENRMEALVASMPGGETVCACNQVSKSAIVKVMGKEGLTTADEIKQKTKASGSCGGCRPMLEAIVKVTLSGASMPISGAEHESVTDHSICSCMSAGHEELIQLISTIGAISSTEVRESLDLTADHIDGCRTCEDTISYYIERNRSQEAQHCSLPLDTFEEFLSWCSKQRVPASIYAAASEEAESVFGIKLHDIAIQACPAGYEIYVGGHARHPVAEGQLLCLTDTREGAIRAAQFTVELYSTEGWFNEKMWEWVERTGIGSIRERVMEMEHKQLEYA
ncbi:nitrite reductase large subunit NirB [Paenibacillus sp. 453mf]|uniref:nitrite reductase large subunit NirB n=1 Tax=Paenibacillus sp. 453mf TaxID=1761874 RepID=UPI0008EC1672|nr:nitrite reductase large subunit NirB [Paenibacillus sp. 453mf]SFS57219.1 nitrite reductase (NADH) large subunit [Paenibacillus sp. 453mf]